MYKIHPSGYLFGYLEGEILELLKREFSFDTFKDTWF